MIVRGQEFEIKMKMLGLLVVAGCSLVWACVARNLVWSSEFLEGLVVIG